MDRFKRPATAWQETRWHVLTLPCSIRPNKCRSRSWFTLSEKVYASITYILLLGPSGQLIKYDMESSPVYRHRNDSCVRKNLV
jgi:hypothetical protein